MALSLKHQTAAQFAARFREAYRNASREQAAKMAWWLIEKINAGDLTDNQCRTAFGLSVAKWGTVKTRMTTLHDQYAAVKTARGE